MIDGQGVTFGQKKNKLSDYYFNVLKRESRQAINDLSFAQVQKISQGTKTDSLYFLVELKHHDERWTLSVRNHPPIQYDEHYLYFYANKYASIGELRFHIQKELVKIYNRKAEKLGIALAAPPPKTREQVIKAANFQEHHLAIAPSLLQKMDAACEDLADQFGWTDLSEAAKLLGSRYAVTKKSLAVSKLEKAYTRSNLYEMTFRLMAGEWKKFIKPKKKGRLEN